MAIEKKTTTDGELLNTAFRALKRFDWGQDVKPLRPIDDAVVGASSVGEKKRLAARLAAVLNAGTSRAAKDYACRKLSLVASAESVPALAKLLADAELSHPARYALERVESTEAVKAIRAALPEVEGPLKASLINSLRQRRDGPSTGALIALLRDPDVQVAGAAAAALGAIGSPQAAAALSDFHKKAPEQLRVEATDACLACAEQLLGRGKKSEAARLYKVLSSKDQPKHVRRAVNIGRKRAT